MDIKSFLALEIREAEEGQFTRHLVERTIDSLPPGEVLVQVHYSSLNYKDALSASGNKGVTKNYPHTPGIDAAGVVVESESKQFKAGDKVIVAGFDLGMNTSGGYGQYIRVPANWVIPLPTELTLKESMLYGIAGFTAAISVEKLIQNGIRPEDGEILVTGATGGVGSMAVSILAHLNYQVVASTGKTEEHDFLKSLGVSRIIDREATVDTSSRPLLKGLWTSVIDNVGGPILETALRTCKIGGIVTTCGNVGGISLNTNVFPFILRGVSLVGIDSTNCPHDLRIELWEKMATVWKTPVFHSLCYDCRLDTLGEQIDLILQGKTKGRVVVDLQAS